MVFDSGVGFYFGRCCVYILQLDRDYVDLFVYYRGVLDIILEEL